MQWQCRLMIALLASAMADVSAVELEARDYAHLESLYLHLHRHPELSFKEERTAARIANELSALGFEVTRDFGVTGVVAVLAWLSLLFVFGENTNPTAERPFFFHGRLISGAMAPFALAWVRGLQVSATVLPQGARRAAGWAGLLVTVSVVLASEVFLSWQVFGSAYNWFALP